MSADLQDLLRRVESARGGLDDEDLGRLICAALGKPFDSTDLSCGDDGSDHFEVFAANEHWCVWGGYRDRMPDVSLDAALALVERVLPETGFELSFVPGNEPPWDVTLWVQPRRVWVSAATAPLALLAALLKAISATGLATGNQAPVVSDETPEAPNPNETPEGLKPLHAQGEGE